MDAAAPASTGTWTPLGGPALMADVPGYGPTSEGFHNLSGRIQSFDYDRRHPTWWYAAVANGGVYETTNAGRSWHSIGDGLPSQIIGALALMKDGTIVAGSGDPAFGGDSYAGLGAFWSSDRGHSWHRAAGIPNGTITFRVAPDPAHPKTVYQATGKGLWRSTDDGRSYRNVVLPTTCTSITKPTCFFANIVSDVLVKPPGGRGSAGDPGGEVLAAVGWRAGTAANAAGQPQAPRDGIYVSKTGNPGTFAFVDPAASGFPSVAHAGRTALGMAIGALQNHNYIYALVEDPVRFNKQAGIAGFPAAPVSNTPVGATLNPSVLNGLYGSKDFGHTWVLMASADQMDAPSHQSALGGTECTLGYCAGVQSWYNEWVQPSSASSETAEDGTPLFLSFGLEEVWGGSAAIPAVPNTSNFAVFGRYFSGTTCAALSVPALGGFCPTTGGQQGSTVHPDQHAAMYVPHGADATLVVGNDGGAFSQAQQAQNSTTPYDNNHWGNGINAGLHTLLPYDAVMSSDGTVWAGLQDNGELKLTPDGKETMTMGGDGFFSAVDPQNSAIAYEEYVGGDISVTTNGGKTWTDIQPCYSKGQFSTPFVMDPGAAKHLVAGGNIIEETTRGPGTTSAVAVGLTSTDKNATCSQPGYTAFGSSTDWQPVFDLGTTNGYVNTSTAVDTLGDATYAGFCGSCDIVTQGLPFHSGLATNVGGSAPGKQLTTAGWHVASAIGLPQRIINSVMIDPTNPRNVYVTLGGYGRRWIPPGSLGDKTPNIGSGHVFVSHDAGGHFTDISGDLPDLAANWTVLHDGDLLVADDLGVYALRDIRTAEKAGRGRQHYVPVAHGLPHVPVVSLQITPRSPDELLAATYGRGVQVVELGHGSAPKSHLTSGAPAG
nr:hypothetical protein [Actinomycetota bacterium]